MFLQPSVDFILPSGPCPASIMIVTDFPGTSDLQKGMPLVGYAGLEMDKMLKEAGIYRGQCFVTSVCRQRIPTSSVESLIAMKKKHVSAGHVSIRDKSVLPVVRDGMELLKREIEMCRPNVIIALGNVSMWCLTGQWGIMNWRGSILHCDLDLSLPYKPKVIPTLTPSAVMRQWHQRQIVVHDLRRCARESFEAEANLPIHNFILSPSFGEAIATLSKLQTLADTTTLELAVDIETRAGHIACIGVAWSKLEALCIPLMSVKRPTGYWEVDEEVELVFRLYKLLTSPNIRVLGQNFSYDLQYIYRHWHFMPEVYQDTMLSQHSCFSNMQKSLGFLSSMYCSKHVYWKDDGKNWDVFVGEEQLWEYNCKDCVNTFEIAFEQRRVIAAMKLEDVHAFQQSLVAPVVETMNRGLRIDTQQRADLAMELIQAIAEREQWIIDVLGHPLNPKSPKQMQEFFYDDLKQKPIVDRKTGSVTCNDEALRKIAEREPLLLPIVQRISEHRSLHVFLATFINAPLDTDGRMRCSFNIGGTETYRFSSSQNAFGSGMNLQNIPKGGTTESLTLPNVRKLFIPDPGMTFFDIDLASADLRIVVWESDEPEMKAMLREGLDPYTEVAKEFYHDPSINKRDPRRQTFKSFCHGTNYLGTAKGLAGRLGLSIHESEKTQAWYFDRFPRIKAWQENLKNSVIKRRMVENVFGYRCYFFDRIEGTIFNQAAAWIPQSTVACIINRGYRKIFDEHKHVQVLLQVHDSLSGQYPTHLGESAIRDIVKACEVVLPYDDPLTVPVGIVTSTKSWGDCK